MLTRLLQNRTEGFGGGTVAYGFKRGASFVKKSASYAVGFDVDKKAIHMLSVDSYGNILSDSICMDKGNISRVRKTLCGGWKIYVKGRKRPQRILVPAYTYCEDERAGILYAHQKKQAADFRALMESFM